MSGAHAEERGGRWGAVVDCFVILLAIAMVLTLLDESFWSRDYLVAGLVPVVVLLALAWWLRRFQDGVWIYSVVALLAYAPLGALAALQRPGPWIAPAVDTMSRVLGDTFSAPRLFVSTLPPVEASGSLMLLPYAIGFAAAAPAAWLALATTRPLAPAVSVIVALGATIPVAVLVPDYYIARGALLSIILLAWVAGRARRAESLVVARRSGLLTSAAAVAVVAIVSGLTSLLVPDDDQTERTRLDPAGETQVLSDAADSIVPSGAARTQLFRVTGASDGARLRFGTLDLYDGEAWVPAEESPGAGPAGTFRRLGREVEALRDGPETEVRVRISPGYVSDWLPLLGDLTGLELDYRDGRTQLDEVRYNQATGSAVVVGGVDPRDDYTFTAVLPPDTFGDDDTMTATDDQRQPAGAFLDQFLVPFDRTELKPLQRVLLLARYLRQNGEVRVTGGSSQKPVDLGLRLLGADRIAATPFQYSAVTALGASRLGVPARVVVGAAPGRRGIVTQGDVTSWVELQFANGTWRTLEPQRYTGVHPYAEEESEDDRLGAPGWVKKELELDEDEIKIPKGADIELSPDAVIEEESNPWEVVGLAALGLTGAAVVAMLVVPGVKVLRRARRRRTSSWSGIYVNGWQEVLDTALDVGAPVPEGWSRLAQAGRLRTGRDLARRADAAVFAPVALPAGEGRAFWDACQQLRGELLAAASLRRRVWCHFNPSSLMAGWARGRRSARQVRHEDRGAGRQQAAGA